MLAEHLPHGGPRIIGLLTRCLVSPRDVCSKSHRASCDLARGSHLFRSAGPAQVQRMGNLLLEKVRPSQVGRKLTAATLVLNDHKDTWTLGPDS